MSHQAGERGNTARIRKDVAPPHPQAGTRDLEGAWLRAVAIVWSDPGALDALKRDPKHFLGSRCGYAPPEDLTIEVQDAQKCGISWRSNAEVVLDVGPAPELSEQPVALGEIAAAFMTTPICAC